ncbi:unnamed protein product [Colias eurytheme]|nr:unnamed protein product [Colias eurytheme]
MEFEWKISLLKIENWEEDESTRGKRRDSGSRPKVLSRVESFDEVGEESAGHSKRRGRGAAGRGARGRGAPTEGRGGREARWDAVQAQFRATRARPSAPAAVLILHADL